jgi:hypothetical protein
MLRTIWFIAALSQLQPEGCSFNASLNHHRWRRLHVWYSQLQLQIELIRQLQRMSHHRRHGILGETFLKAPARVRRGSQAASGDAVKSRGERTTIHIYQRAKIRLFTGNQKCKRDLLLFLLCSLYSPAIAIFSYTDSTIHSTAYSGYISLFCKSV